MCIALNGPHLIVRGKSSTWAWILIEAGELLEVFQYTKEEKSIDKVKEELADVLMYSILLSDAYHLDLDEIINEKLIINENKYPASLVKGSSKKYDEYKEKSRKK